VTIWIHWQVDSDRLTVTKTVVVIVVEIVIVTFGLVGHTYHT
jgi:hypothetical protein